jgi:hypothetical protein
MLDLQIGGPDTDAGEDEEVGDSEDDGDNDDIPPLQSIESNTLGDTQCEDAPRRADELSAQPEDSVSLAGGVTEDEDVTNCGKL